MDNQDPNDALRYSDIYQRGMDAVARRNGSMQRLNSIRNSRAIGINFLSRLSTIGVSSYEEVSGVQVLLGQHPDWAGTLIVRNDTKAHERERVEQLARQLKVRYPNITLEIQ